MWDFKIFISPFQVLLVCSQREILSSLQHLRTFVQNTTKYNYILFFFLRYEDVRGVFDIHLLEFITYAANHELSRVSSSQVWSSTCSTLQ